MRKPFGSLAMAAALAVAGSGIASASDYPTRTINWIVMWPAGGGTDSVSRIMAQYMERELGQRIVIQNIVGGGGSIGYTAAKAARPDGYTLVTIQSDLSKFAPMELADIAITDFEIIGAASVQAPILVTRGDSPFESLDDLLSAARDNPNTITVGVSDIGGVHHQPVVLLDDAAGTQVRAVAHEGSPQMAAGLLGGHVDAISSWVKQNASYVQGGQMRFLAYFGGERLSEFPDVPTVTELGYDVVWESPYGIGVPAGTPDAVVNRLAEALAAIWENEDFIAELVDLGHVPVQWDGEYYREYLERIEQDIANVMRILN